MMNPVLQMMAPSPEYDKEPKAPDKSATNISSEDTKLLHNLINDQHHNSEHKTTNSATNSEVENNKHVETLDDDNLRALLNEALTYKCPKDLEGKSSLFKELLEEVKQDDQEACSAAARTLTGCRGSRRGGRGRRALPHSNSLQDLVAALAAEPAPRRHARPHPPPAVSARAIHGGSLPSGVDTSSLLSEEPAGRGAGYLATVRCVNPPPLAERRVSASDANAPHELELLNRRSKPTFPMTYTARATLEIGSGSVCSGRAVTTTTASNQMSHISTPPADNATGGTDANALNPSSENNEIELEEIVCHRATKDNRDTASFSDYLADQEKLFQVLEATDSKTTGDEYSINVLENNNNIKSSKHSDGVEPMRKSAQDVSSENDINMSTNTENDAITRALEPCGGTGAAAGAGAAPPRDRGADDTAPDRYVLTELPNNAYIFLTFPKRLLTPLNRNYRPAEVTEIESDDTVRRLPETKPRRKKDKPVGTCSSNKRKDTINKNALRVLLFENLFKNDRGESTPGRASSAFADKEVDSAIPFSCITTPEVVASCNTTPSALQSAIAVDPKPLPLGAELRAAASLAGAPPPPAPRARADLSDEQPRSMCSFSGLPLSRPNYGAIATTSNEEYKKSLDENGNSLQGYCSPLSGSSQHKKPRRKKSSKNETVIDCRQLDGYQGDKDVNELLRFIESNAEQRAPKLRAKHKDDADDKGKKRSSERRRDRDSKPKRASSLEELSRSRLEDLTAAPRAPPPGKPERRSWGDAAPPPDPPGAAPAVAAVAAGAEQADFQTVTKKRKPRRRTEEATPRRARAPSPRRQDSAPPSDRSNDSNDDMDSVHSLPERAPPAAPPAPPPHASYADIARTRHNIPDLIESCNFYADGESAGADPQRRADPPPAAAAESPPDAEAYSSQDPRSTAPPPPQPARRPPPRDKGAPPALGRRERKERPALPPPASPPECPAPDVVSDRRPPVILLDSAAQPRDMDGITFGFDINEQLLGGGGRRPRCDLVRDAVEAPAVAVRAAKRALRYVPPPPPPDRSQLHQLIEYVGSAWEDVVRCGGGKVRYYSE